MSAVATAVREWQHIEMNPPGSKEWNFEIPYVWSSTRYGRAEFSVCAKWKRGRITDLWISPMQQENETGKIYHLNVHGSTGLSNSWGAKIWYVAWCRLHKAQNMNIYVPNDTDTLTINLLSAVSLMFTKRKVGV